MNWRYKPGKQTILDSRNKLFLRAGSPSLESQGFEASPFTNAWFGKNDLGDYSYEFCRLEEDSEIVILEIYISKGDRWVKMFINIFKLVPDINSLKELKGQDGLQFGLPPNSLSNMQLRNDSFKGPPIFNFNYHKIGLFLSENGFQKELRSLESLVKSDLLNIDFFIKRWHEMHCPLMTQWDGTPLGS